MDEVGHSGKQSPQAVHSSVIDIAITVSSVKNINTVPKSWLIYIRSYSTQA